MLTRLPGNKLLGKLRKMRSLADDADDEVKPSGPAKGQAVEQPAWMRTLLDRCRDWLAALPEVKVMYLIAKIITETMDPSRSIRC